MRVTLRTILFSTAVLALLTIAGSSALAETTCACDNGQQVSTTRDDSEACNSACSMVGADGGVPAAVGNSDDDYEDDDGAVIVDPRRIRGPVGHPRRR